MVSLGIFRYLGVLTISGNIIKRARLYLCYSFYTSQRELAQPEGGATCHRPHRICYDKLVIHIRVGPLLVAANC